MDKQFPYLGAYKKRKKEEGQIECGKCAYQYQCPCFGLIFSDTCLAYQKEVKHDDNPGQAI